MILKKNKNNFKRNFKRNTQKEILKKELIQLFL